MRRPSKIASRLSCAGVSGASSALRLRRACAKSSAAARAFCDS